VLADEWLRDIKSINEIVNAVGVVFQQVDDGKSDWCGEGPQELTSSVVLLDVRMRYGKRGSRVQLLSHDELPCMYAS
jgi:hypothetical protein